MAGSLQNLHKLLRAGHGCLPHTQLGRGGTAEVLSTSGEWRYQHSVAVQASVPSAAPSEQEQPASNDAAAPSAPGRKRAAGSLHSSAPGPTAYSDPQEPAPPPLRFVSSEWRAAAQRAPLPERRLPICFPNMTLQMLKLTPEQVQMVRETGWLREVAFKTTPDVTKLEIAAYLESVYGMSVERVSTINYLGKVFRSFGNGRMRHVFRADDWKKAYVIFRPPPGMEHLLTEQAAAATASKAAEEEEEEEEGTPVLERIRAAARAPRSARLRSKREGWDVHAGGTGVGTAWVTVRCRS